MELGGQKRQENKVEDSKDGRDETHWPAAARLGSLGVGTGLSGPRGADGRTEGGGRGNRDQFCQNWVHTLGATELGWPRERAK